MLQRDYTFILYTLHTFSNNNQGVLGVLYFTTTNQPTNTKLNGKVDLTSIKETDKTQPFRLMPAD
jgi:hypothetical protein